MKIFIWMCLLQICLLCRRRGHSLKNCPDKNDEVAGNKLCYNCGETGHSLANCPQPLEDGMDLISMFNLVILFL